MASGYDFHSPHFGREQLDAHACIPRHRHRDGYITVVLGGGYQEAGFDGRRHLSAGDVVVHGRYDAHLDHVGTLGAQLINLPLPPGQSMPSAFRIDDPDLIARSAERDPFEAALMLHPAMEVAAEADWPDLLAAELMATSHRSLGWWASAAGLAAETLSRGFRKAYGITPARFRAELRARQAMAMIEQTRSSLAAIAADCGFADQPHLSRAIVALTGRPPGFWRHTSIPFKTGPSAPS